jgi:Tfp pilus assembly protein PilF
VETYESVALKLPRRTFWYQIEPIQAYLELGDYKKVFELTDKILNDGNRAYSELYDLRAQAYTKLGEPDKAKTEFARAIYYNSNYEKLDH